MLISVDEVEDSTFALEERIGSLEEQNSLLLARLNILESALTNVESDVQSKRPFLHLFLISIFLHYMILSLTKYSFLLLKQVLNDTVANLDTDNTTSERLDAVENDIIRLDAKVFGSVSFYILVNDQRYRVLSCFYIARFVMHSNLCFQF